MFHFILQGEEDDFDFEVPKVIPRQTPEKTSEKLPAKPEVEKTTIKSFCIFLAKVFCTITLGMHPANERHRYKVTTSPIGWAHT